MTEKESFKKVWKLKAKGFSVLIDLSEEGTSKELKKTITTLGVLIDNVADEMEAYASNSKLLNIKY